MAVPIWQPGTLYQPGSLVRPQSSGGITQDALDNPSFESGATGWTFIDGGGFSIGQDAGDSFEGSWRLAAFDNGGPTFASAQNDARIPVQPGQTISAACFLKCVAGPDVTRAGISISWFSAAMAPLGKSLMDPDNSQVDGHVHTEPQNAGMIGLAANNFWTQVIVTGIAPAGAAFFTVNAEFGWLPDGAWRADAFTINHADQAPADPLIFRAVQAEAGFSGSSEPDWPDTLGLQVVDNEVTWEAVAENNVVWEAHRILVSGAVEPTFPIGIEASVADGSIVWVLDTRRVKDPNCPNSKIVAIAASKIFAADGDIIPFSATVNPLDWTTRDDAGYIPFGLQTYGADPVAALGLYRSNLIAANASGYQMWQVDEDPANMALLDASPVGCEFHETMQPVMNDLVFLTKQGLRNISVAGASTNIQSGSFGKQIDPLVLAAIKTGQIPNALYYPGTGQYWVWFGNEAFVLTVNGTAKDDQSWSRYIFPSDIDDWTTLDGDLYLRSGDKVWLVSDEALMDDEIEGVGEEFTGTIWWHYLGMGGLGQEKMMIGFDLVCDGEVAVSFGYNQTNPALATDPYTLSGDTLPGDIIPMPISGPSFQLRLEFSGNQEWEWEAAAIYLQPDRVTS